MHTHDFGWPHRRQWPARDVQTCSRCGAERLSDIQFAGSTVTVDNGWWHRAVVAVREMLHREARA